MNQPRLAVFAAGAVLLLAACVATDLYNRGLTQALSSPNGAVVELRSGFYALPFGQQVPVHLEPDALRWADRELIEFVPVAELWVRGLRLLGSVAVPFI
jgi:hypothetical protein